jgi:hypothetical protein
MERPRWGDSKAARYSLAAAMLAATGALTVAFVSSGGKGSADAATSLADYLPIEKVAPNVVKPQPGPKAATGRFTVDCGTNGNGKFSPDNPVAQPGIKNGAEHLHDFVGNLAITAGSSDDDLNASGTTCTNGDKSSYFWPVVRIDKSVRANGEAVRQALAGTKPEVTCPTVGDRLPAVPAGAKTAVDQRLAALDTLTASAGVRIKGARPGVDVQLNNAVLTWLGAQRAGLLAEIAGVIAAHGGERPTGMIALADCDLSYDGLHAAMPGSHAGPSATAANPQVKCPSVRDKLPGVPQPAMAEVNRGLAELDRLTSAFNEKLAGNPTPGPDALSRLTAQRAAILRRLSAAIGWWGSRPDKLAALAACTLDQQPPAPAPSPSPSPTGSPSPLPTPQGPNLELPNNTGGIVQPASVLIEYRGNAVSKVTPMPKFLRELTGDAKPTSRGPANARATWTCSGFGDRRSDKYPICPVGSKVQRVQDFPGCWDGKNIDSTNHRTHVAFADKTTGACPQGFVAIPQLRITISYDIPHDVQVNGQYAVDSFPEENHNPFSDHNDFINVNANRQMKIIASCINQGRRCS